MPVDLEFDGELAIITLSNPPVNAFDLQLGLDLLAAVKEVSESDARALLTKSDSDNFCAGADVSMFVGKTNRQGADLIAQAMNLIDMLENLPIPTVCAVNGMCLAAGMEIMLAHDIVIASDQAQIGQVEASMGTTTLAGGAQRIAARAGVARAKQMVFEGRPYPAKTLEAWGIVNKTVPDEDLEEKAFKYAMRMAKGPTVAISVGKGVINAYGKSGIGGADDALRSGAPQVFNTQDKQRCVTSFVEKGPQVLFDGSLYYEGK